MRAQSFSHVYLFAIPWSVAHQVPLSLEFTSQECWSGVLFPSPGDLPDPGIEPRSPALWADSLPLSHQGSPRQPGSVPNRADLGEHHRGGLELTVDRFL